MDKTRYGVIGAGQMACGLAAEESARNGSTPVTF